MSVASERFAAQGSAAAQERIAPELSVEFDQWLASLWHGKALAYTLAVLAAGIAAVCFLVAHLTSPPPPGEGDQPREGQ